MLIPFGMNIKSAVTGLFSNNRGKVSIKRTFSPNYTKTNDKEKPFMLKEDAGYSVTYTDENGKEYNYYIKIPKNYKWDGASIPSSLNWLIGEKDKEEFIEASLVHDYLCENKSLIGNNRALSSSIFSALLRYNGTGSKKAGLMALAVDWYQYCFADWKDNTHKMEYVA